MRNSSSPASGMGCRFGSLLMLGLASLLSGCAAVATLPAASALLPASTGNAQFYGATTVRLGEGNFVTLQTNLTGQSKGFALLGLITLVPASFTRALDGVYEKSTVQTGRPQTLANVVTERTSTYWILFSIPKVSIRADLVEFTRTPEGPPPPHPSAR